MAKSSFIKTFIKFYLHKEGFLDVPQYTWFLPPTRSFLSVVIIVVVAHFLMYLWDTWQGLTVIYVAI